MQPEFWHERWQRGEIGFHRDSVHPWLVSCWPRLDCAPGDTVFVPLCGKTRDIGFFLDQGCRVIANELSPLAIEQLFSELGLDPTVDELPDQQCWRAADLCVYVGDFFTLQSAQMPPIALTYDRAALVALPAAMRSRYAKHLLALTKRSPQLLITFEYPQEAMQGPPFAVGMDEVERLYAAHYAIQLLEEAEVIDREPGLQARGLGSLTERAILLSPTD